MRAGTLGTVAAAALLGSACAAVGQSAAVTPPAAQHGLAVQSPELAGGSFDAALTCDGPDRAPTVRWSGLDHRAVFVAVTLTDPDAPGGDFTHWLLASDRATDTDGTVTSPPGPLWVVGMNDFGKREYDGPCPPPGQTHRYRLTVVSADRGLHLSDGFTVSELNAALSAAAVLDRGTLTATYGR